jgi:hypothetical protein
MCPVFCVTQLVSPPSRSVLVLVLVLAARALLVVLGVGARNQKRRDPARRGPGHVCGDVEAGGSVAAHRAGLYFKDFLQAARWPGPMGRPALPLYRQLATDMAGQAPGSAHSDPPRQHPYPAGHPRSTTGRAVCVGGGGLASYAGSRSESPVQASAISMRCKRAAIVIM